MIKVGIAAGRIGFHPEGGRAILRLRHFPRFLIAVVCLSPLACSTSWTGIGGPGAAAIATSSQVPEGTAAHVEFRDVPGTPPPPRLPRQNTDINHVQLTTHGSGVGSESPPAGSTAASEPEYVFLERPAPATPDPFSSPQTQVNVSTAKAGDKGEKNPETPLPRCSELPPRPLAMAMTAFLNNRPEEAVKFLQSYSAQDQELVMLLLPILAEVDRAGILTENPRSDKVLAVLTSVRNLEADLRPHAPLVMEKLSFCQDHPEAIEAFGVVKKRASNKYRAGDYPYIYAELHNLQDRRGKDGRYAIRLSSSLELRTSDGRAVHRFPTIENAPLYSWSPRTDFFTRIGFQLPAGLSPGLYSLRVRVTDLETGRSVERGLPLQVIPAQTSTR